VSVREDSTSSKNNRRTVPGRGYGLAIWASHMRAQLLFMVLDAVAVVVAYGVAEVIYFRDVKPADYWRHFVVFCILALIVHLTANRLFGLYGRIWRHAGIEEARQVILASASALVVLLVLKPVLDYVSGEVSALHFLHSVERVPMIVIVIGCAFDAMATGALRFHSRLFAWQRGSRNAGLRVAVIGSREAGAAAIREMLRTPGSGLVPVAVFDDDGKGHGLSLLGVPVVGAIEDIPVAAERYTIQQVLLAIPSPDPELVARALRASEAARVAMKILPSVHDIVAGEEQVAGIREAREPKIEDLLGRSAVTTDLGAVRRALEGLRVLITGAGGSIGSEIARQVAEFKPAQLILLDHDETHLHDTAISLASPCDQVLADVADRAAVFEVFHEYEPEVVFHAAAHKHVPMLEAHPLEAARVNVFGTLNVVNAAATVGSKRFVFISTDKAVRPSSVMGASKRLAEQVVLNNCPQGSLFSVVRFGNVLGSRGSVIPTFNRQIAAGGPVTVTDPRMTRFFMSVEEAVQLVLQASVLSEGREIFMLEMGEPVSILDLAERMVRLSGHRAGVDGIPISVVGARPGEKLHEELNDPDEDVLVTVHPSILRLVPSRAPDMELDTGLGRLREAMARRDAKYARDLVFSMASHPEKGQEASASGEGAEQPSARQGERTDRPGVVPVDSRGPDPDPIPA
jgi:FlaA1/EpsC-like NDP-sugar epimerase